MCGVAWSSRWLRGGEFSEEFRRVPGRQWSFGSWKDCVFGGDPPSGVVWIAGLGSLCSEQWSVLRRVSGIEHLRIHGTRNGPIWRKGDARPATAGARFYFLGSCHDQTDSTTSIGLWNTTDIYREHGHVLGDLIEWRTRKLPSPLISAPVTTQSISTPTMLSSRGPANTIGDCWRR